MKKITKIEKEFLKESNAIEGIFDDDSLQQAIHAWEYLKNEKELTIDVVLKTHKLLMLHQNISPADKGYFRTCRVRIGDRYGFPPKEIRSSMEIWLEDVKCTVEIGGENNMKADHIVYENIHPFVDGNGRTGRMFLNWERLQVKFPILVIKESERQDYYLWFK